MPSQSRNFRSRRKHLAGSGKVTIPRPTSNRPATKIGGDGWETGQWFRSLRYCAQPGSRQPIAREKTRSMSSRPYTSRAMKKGVIWLPVSCEPHRCLPLDSAKRQTSLHRRVRRAASQYGGSASLYTSPICLHDEYARAIAAGHRGHPSEGRRRASPLVAKA
jgi:hypothetical protein